MVKWGVLWLIVEKGRPLSICRVRLFAQSRSDLVIPTALGDCLANERNQRRWWCDNKDVTPYSCQEGPSLALTSAYTRATDLVAERPMG